jgi:single-strand DNA-binding protein
MFSLNRAQIIGNLTRDPEMRYTPNGQPVASFAVATNRRWKDKDGNNQDETQYHEIVAWGKLAEIVSQILHKGNKVYIEGRLQTRNWEAQDGSRRQRTEIIAENFVALTPKGSSEDTNFSAPQVEGAEEFPIKDTKKPAKKEAKEEDEINLDEIPF